MKLVLFSDLHLDTPFAGDSPAIARRRRRNLREVLRRITALVSEAGAEALLCGGDLYEQDRFSSDTGEFLRDTFAQIHPFPVYIAPGNHDWMGPASLYRRVAWSPNVFIFQHDRLEPVALADGLTLWGAAHRAPANTDDFLAGFRVDREGAHIALFHGSERNSLLAQGSGKVPHAPFDASELERAGIHHALLGHYHQPRDADRFTYPGNPEPLSFGEQGERGAVIVTVEADGRIRRERRRVAIGELHELEVDVTGCNSQQEVRDRASSRLTGLHGIARLTLVGELGPEADLRAEDLRDIAAGLDELLIRVGNVRVAYDFETIAREPTVRGQFVRDVRADGSLDDDERHRVLVTGLRALEGRADLEVL